MSRRTPSFLVLALVLVGLTAACAESTAPEPAPDLRAETVCERNSNGTCL